VYLNTLEKELEIIECMRKRKILKKENLQNNINELFATADALRFRIKELTRQIKYLEQRYSQISIGPRVEYTIREEVDNKVEYVKTLARIESADISSAKKGKLKKTNCSERQTIWDRIRNSILFNKNKENMVFNPTEKEMNEIVPLGNKVRIRRVGMYDWMFGTIKFMFTRDIKGDVYAKTQEGQILFDDFVAINELSELKKAINSNIKNATFSENSSDLAEANFAIVGNEFDNVD
jgi:hypothetical protein